MASWDKKLLTAAENGNIKEVELCVKNGANLECRTDGYVGLTPLMWAARYGHVEVMPYLVTHGSQIETPDTLGGQTPLMLAALVGHLEVVTYLVTHGSQLDATDLDGRTALHHAAKYGNIDVTNCLIDQGCSPWVKSKQDKTPYDLVKIGYYDDEEEKRKKEEVMDFLKKEMVEIVLLITLVGLIFAVNLHGLWNMAIPIMFGSMAVQTDVDQIDMYLDKRVPLGGQ